MGPEVLDIRIYKLCHVFGKFLCDGVCLPHLQPLQHIFQQYFRGYLLIVDMNQCNLIPDLNQVYLNAYLNQVYLNAYLNQVYFDT